MAIAGATMPPLAAEACAIARGPFPSCSPIMDHFARLLHALSQHVAFEITLAGYGDPFSPDAEDALHLAEDSEADVTRAIGAVRAAPLLLPGDRALQRMAMVVDILLDIDAARAARVHRLFLRHEALFCCPEEAGADHHARITRMLMRGRDLAGALAALPLHADRLEGWHPAPVTLPEMPLAA